MAPSQDLAILEKLLGDLFREPEEFRRFLARLPDTGDLPAHLPGSTASLNALLFSAAEGLDARGLLNEDFFLRLREVRSAKFAEIDVVAGRFRSRTVRRRRRQYAAFAVLALFGGAAFFSIFHGLRRVEETIEQPIVRAAPERPHEVAPAKQAVSPPTRDQEPAVQASAKTAKICYGCENKIEMGSNSKLEINGIKVDR